LCPKVTGQHKTKIREKIIQSAIESFAETGFDRTKMEDIAKRLNLSKGTLYLYFASKEELFLAICEYYLKMMKQQQDSAVVLKKEEIVLDAERFYDNFRQLMGGNDRVILEMIVESSRNAKLKKGMYEHRLKVYDTVVDHLNKQIERGFIKKDIDVNSLASALLALHDGLIASRMLGVSEAHTKRAWVAMVRAVTEGISN
jgi:AcrR family transcriptional regulator